MSRERSQCPDSQHVLRLVALEMRRPISLGAGGSGHWERLESAMMARVDLTDEAVKTLLIIGGGPASIAVSQPGIVITLEGIHVQPREIPPDYGYCPL